jgi:hypothetical protein
MGSAGRKTPSWFSTSTVGLKNTVPRSLSWKLCIQEQFEVFYLLGYKVDVSEEYVSSIFRLEEGAKQETTLQVAIRALLGLLFDSEDGGHTFLRNVG